MSADSPIERVKAAAGGHSFAALDYQVNKRAEGNGVGSIGILNVRDVVANRCKGDWGVSQRVVRIMRVDSKKVGESKGGECI